MSFKVTSVENYFETLNARFNPEGAKGVDMIFQWDLSGNFWHAIIQDQKVEVVEGKNEAATCTLEMNADNFVKMINGDLNQNLAILTRKLKVSGNKMAAGRVRTIFPIG